MNGTPEVTHVSVPGPFVPAYSLKNMVWMPDASPGYAYPLNQIPDIWKLLLVFADGTPIISEYGYTGLYVRLFQL